MNYAEAEKFRYNPFDLTKVWSHAEFPLIPVGKFTLNRNPKNYFAEVEQIAFSPANMVPGIEPSPDKMLQVSKRGSTSNLIAFLSLLGSLLLSQSLTSAWLVIVSSLAH